jgi:ribose 5-phosphate isomerase B
MINIAIGCDHAGFVLKELFKSNFDTEYTFVDMGTFSLDSVDYPDYAHQVAQSVENHLVDFGILICGSANGVAITANKHNGIRAAIAWLPEIAALAKQHNNANILCIPARFVSTELAFEIFNAYITSSFEGGRHQNRVDKISICN